MRRVEVTDITDMRKYICAATNNIARDIETGEEVELIIDIDKVDIPGMDRCPKCGGQSSGFKLDRCPYCGEYMI